MNCAEIKGKPVKITTLSLGKNAIYIYITNQIKIFILINNDNNNRYSTYKGNIVICIYTYTHSNTYIHIDITAVKCFIVLFNWGDGHPGIICCCRVHLSRYL